MSDTERIENVLRRAPKVKVPAGLAEKLKTDITLPRASATASATDFWVGLRRWFPGFATAALFLTCLVALGVQQRVLSGLRHEQKQLESAAVEAQQVADSKRAKQAQVQAQAAQLAQLRKDNAELQQLRAAVAQLREQLQQLPALRAEHQRLVAQAKDSHSAGATNDPFAMAQDTAQRIQCVSNMKQIGLGLRMWVNEHGDVMPPDFLTAQNELNSPKILVCPSDSARTNRLGVWTGFTSANATYEFLTPNVSVSERESPRTIITRCPIHGTVGLLDGSVHQNLGNLRITTKNGRLTLE